MNNNVVAPQNPKDLIRELTSPNQNEIDKFTEHFSNEIIKFCEKFSDAYIVFLQLDPEVQRHQKKGEIVQADFVFMYTYQILDNLFTSVKMLVLGYFSPSGNLWRQVAEGIAIATLCSVKGKVNRQQKKRLIPFEYTKALRQNKTFAKAHMAISILELNQKRSEFTKHGLKILHLIKHQANNFSHPSLLSTIFLGSKEDPGKLYFGGNFDEGNIEFYKTELKHRIAFCETLPEFLNGLIDNVKKL